MSEHRLVIIGSLIENVPLVEKAKKRGYYTIVCDGYADGPAKHIADRAYTIDVRDVDAIAKMCVEEKADGIIGSYSDLIFEQITKIAAKAGIRWYAVPDMIPYYREKNVTKSVLAELGVHVPKNVTLKEDFKDEDLKDFHFPLVIKPVNGWGSKGIYVAHSVQEIRDKFLDVRKRATEAEIEVEEFSRGREYNMMTWLIDGEVHVISIADREKNPQEGDRIPLLNRVVYPAKNIRNIIDEAKSVLQRFSARMGQTSGALSMQFFYNEHGVEVCEIAGRLFGYEHDLVTYCSGFDIEEMLLNYVYDEEALKAMFKDYSPFFDVSCEGLYFVGVQGATVGDMSVARGLLEDPHVIQNIQFYKEGEVIDNYGPKPYLFRVYLKADTREELDAVTEKFFREMRIYSPDGENICIPFVMEKD